MLHTLVNEYRLTVNGVTFWTPYWINHSHPPYFLGAPLLGKGTPDQVLEVTKRIVSESPNPPSSPEAIRKLMNERGIGVDCSAFVYNVMDRWLEWRGLGSLSDYLVIPRDGVVFEWAGHPENSLGRTEDQVPEFTPLNELLPLWHRPAIRVVGVKHLCSPETAVRVSRLDEMRPGDMIRLTGATGDHMGVIVEVLTDRLIWAQSGRAFNADGSYDLRGVEYEDIMWVNPEADLDQQAWSHDKSYQPKNGLDGVWRLKVLDGA